MTGQRSAPTKAAQVLAVLSEGPATTGEVAAELGWDSHLACAHLKNLHTRKRVAREQFPTGNRRVFFIWRLAEPEVADAGT